MFEMSKQMSKRVIFYVFLHKEKTKRKKEKKVNGKKVSDLNNSNLIQSNLTQPKYFMIGLGWVHYLLGVI